MSRSTMTGSLVLAAALTVALVAPAASASPPLEYRADPVPTDLAGGTVDEVELGAGDWIALAKSEMSAPGGVTCDLGLAPGNDWAHRAGDLGQVAGGKGGHVEAPSTASWTCGLDTGSGEMSWLSLAAVKVARLTRRPLPTGTPVTWGSGSPAAIWGYRAGPVDLPTDGSLGPVASLPLPRGSWWVFAKGVVRYSGRLQASGIECRLTVGDRAGRTTDRAKDGAWAAAPLTLALQEGRTVGRGGKAQLRCRSQNPLARVSDVSFVALRAGRLASGTLGKSFSTVGSGDPYVKLGRRAGPVPVPGDLSYRDVAVMRVPAGRWLLVANAYAEHPGTDPTDAVVACDLTAGADRDRAEGAGIVEPAGIDVEPIVAMTAHDFGSSGGTVRLQCQASPSALEMRSIRLMALKVAR